MSTYYERKRAADPAWYEEQKAKSRAYYHANRDARNAVNKEYQLSNLEGRKRRKDKSIAKGYGITVEELYALRAKTHCAICEDSFGESVKLCIDHCHSSGKVRGAICESCNFMLGHAKDDPTRLRRAAEFLEKLK